ncbi:hypothetical protein PCANC_19079 [Puccinia coronata f. sp. avenae]|uniref:Uncharacterized protein n=1 Tax=Puccinia coronata f. sp. avenae TaxID=200324 RepID=A0A2N5UB11_9BASI|nr:hypothetical protein PCANC_19079 [Puccinia coronata f. sp. avenae]
MVALHYDIQFRANAFAYRVTNPDGSQLVADILSMRPKIQQSCYTTARKFNELEFGDVNPYAEGETQEDWDLTTGTKKSKKAEAGTNSKATPAAEKQANPKGKQLATTAPKSSNYNPNFANRYWEREGSGDRSQRPKGSGAYHFLTDHLGHLLFFPSLPTSTL